MAVTQKYFYPPRPASGVNTFSDNIVGLQLVDGGGLTQGNFEFTTAVTEKVNRTFNIGAFSEPITLENLDIDRINESRLIFAKEFRVYPNLDLTEVTNFSMYGSLAKRLEVSITRIINHFPASLDIRYMSTQSLTGYTATNIVYDSVNDETTFTIDVDRIVNPFAIDYSISAATNIIAREIVTSPLRNLNQTYLDYCIAITNTGNTTNPYDIFKVLSFDPSTSLSSGYLTFYVSGSPFGTTATTYQNNFQVRPNDLVVDQVFAETFNEVEKFLLNRLIDPPYTAVFQVPAENQNGQVYTSISTLTWPLDGVWNLDITSPSFEYYLEQIGYVATELDTYKTDLLSRFLTQESFKEFDTKERKVEKILQIYGRSFDEIKKFIDGMANMTSVNYTVQDDVPSLLLKNLAATLGWEPNVSPITNENFLDSVFGQTNTPTYPGYTRALTPTELNYQFYRNLILNSGYLFRSKGTRKSVEFLLRLVGAPESLVEFNETIYLADQRINMEQFTTQFAQISGGTYANNVPSLAAGQTYKIQGQTYTGFTSTTTYEQVRLGASDYPVDILGYPSAPTDTEDYFFQKGAGWYESTPQHRSPEIPLVTQVFTGANPDIQTQLEPFTYGQLYLERFRDFPYMTEGFKLQKTIDNKKSWVSDDDDLRISTDAGYDAYYYIDNEKLILNAKNVDLFLNPGQGLVYDVWTQSRLYDYPIPESGMTSPFPTPGGVDWTFINPQPKKKTFFEFAQTFWQNTINVRNRMYITDGHTGGYPTLSSIFWKYLEQENTIGIPNNQYTYQKLIDYVEGLGPYWMKLVEQMIPATTIWNSGTRFENSIFQKQKYVYRRQRGCQFVPVPADSCYIIGNVFNYDCSTEFVEFGVYPWLNGDASVSNFQGILANRLQNFLSEEGLTLNECITSTLTTQWYVDMRIGDEVLIFAPFYEGFGLNDVPSRSLWKNTLSSNLDNLYNYGLNYFINGNILNVTNMDCVPKNLDQTLSLNVGINLSISCVN
jgi:hypothetical protein